MSTALAGGERVAFASLIWIFLGKWQIQTLISSDLSKHKATRHAGREKKIHLLVEILWKAIHHLS